MLFDSSFMNLTILLHLITGLVFLLIASLADAKAVYYAVRNWSGGKLQYMNVGMTFLFFTVSVLPFIYSVKFFGNAGILSRPIQSLIWFMGTICFVAVLDGTFFEWKKIDQLVALLIVIGMTWLVVRVNA